MSRYEVLAQLARGGMGEILLARKLGAAGFERLVVLKRPLHLKRSADTVHALVEEARLLAQIHHPNVCHVYDLEEADGELFFVMELLDGISLWTFLEPPGQAAPLPAPVVTALFEQACDGLSAIHALGMVHRDISPSNVFATVTGVVKILDLGIARPAAEASTSVQGKLGYCPPEQLAGGGIDARSDLFALGMVMHDVALARRPPRERVAADAALDLAALPPALAAVIGRAAARDPADRFRSAGELAAALRQAAAPIGRTELATWLAGRFPGPLADRRAVVDRAAATPAEDATTRVIELRPPTIAAPMAPDLRGPIAAPAGIAPLAAPDRLPRATEPLVDRPRPRRRRRAAVAVLLGLAAIASVVALVLARSSDEPHDNGSAAAAAPPRSDDRATPAPNPGIDGRNAAAPRSDAPAASPARIDDRAATASPPRADDRAAAATSPPPAGHAHKRAAPPAAKRPRPEPPAPAAPQAFGAIRIDSQPAYATIDIDGRRVGTTPIKSFRLAAGHHRVHARRVDGKEQDVDVTIAAETQLNLPLSW